MTALLLLASAGLSSAAITYTQDFESGATDWDLTTGATNAAIVDISGDNWLAINTNYTNQIGESPSFDLSTATTATITFNFQTAASGTRKIDLEFWNGSTWSLLQRYTGTAGNGTKSFEVTSGFATDNKWRFYGVSASGSGDNTFYIDDVQITSDATIPESSVALLGALGSLLLLRRRRKASGVPRNKQRGSMSVRGD